MTSRSDLDPLREGPASFDGLPPVRLLVGIGDPEREDRLIRTLGDTEEFEIVQRCLTADELLTPVRNGQVDALLVAIGLHRLTGSLLAEIARTTAPLIVLAAHPQEWQHLKATVLPLDADASSVRHALLHAVRGYRTESMDASIFPHEGQTQPIHPATPDEPTNTAAGASAAEPTVDGCLLVVASGAGSPGRTTVSLGLAAALGAVEPTIVVDLDLSGPSLAAYIDADTTRNLYMLAHAEPQSPHDWDQAIEGEVQPLGYRSPLGVVLCGVPTLDVRTGVSTGFFERLLAQLRRKYRYIILDIGTELLGTDTALYRIALALADQVLLVSSADFVGLWHARTALALLQTQMDISSERISLVINSHDRRLHHGRSEIEWALGVPAAAVIPYDHQGAQRTLTARRPLVLDRKSVAGRALLELADRVHGGRITLPPAAQDTGRRSRVQQALRPRRRVKFAQDATQPIGAISGDNTPTTS